MERRQLSWTSSVTASLLQGWRRSQSCWKSWQCRTLLYSFVATPECCTWKHVRWSIDQLHPELTASHSLFPLFSASIASDSTPFLASCIAERKTFPACKSICAWLTRCSCSWCTHSRIKSCCLPDSWWFPGREKSCHIRCYHGGKEEIDHHVWGILGTRLFAWFRGFAQAFFLPTLWSWFWMVSGTGGAKLHFDFPSLSLKEFLI